MEIALSEKSISLIEGNGYKIKTLDKGLEFRKKTWDFPIFFLLLIALGLPTLLIGVFSDWKIVFLAILMIGVPLLYDKWRLPRRVRWNLNGISVHRTFGKSLVIEPVDISDLDVSEKILSSHTSPFEEGNQDFVYDLILNEKNRDKSYRLLRIQGRKSLENEMRAMHQELSTSLLS